MRILPVQPSGGTIRYHAMSSASAAAWRGFILSLLSRPPREDYADAKTPHYAASCAQPSCAMSTDGRSVQSARKNSRSARAWSPWWRRRYEELDEIAS